MALPTRTRPSFPFSQSLPPGRFHKPLTILHQKAAAAAAKWLQLCPPLCDAMDWSLPGFSVHGIFQARVLEWGAIAFSAIRGQTDLKPQSQKTNQSNHMDHSLV